MENKKINKNIIVFVFYVIFVISGILSVEVFRPIGGSILRVVRGQYDIEEAKSTIDSALTDELTYHDQLININGLKENIIGNKVIRKSDATIVKSETGSLMDVVEELDENEISSVVKTIRNLKNISEDNGARFLYCAAPKKELFEKAPSNVNNYFQDNYEDFLVTLTKKNVPYVDFSKTLIESGISESDMFYYTDHHWKSYAGFVATNSICEELNTKYSFHYNKQYTDINNYNISNYSDWFLGSKGKKAGKYFTWNGADDFDLIVPKFQTDMTEEQPFKNTIRKGSFEESVLYMENMEKDFYRVNTYATYSGGDFRLQIMKNNLNPKGEKVLLIRDSFACVVAPFLALQTSELHICDVRDDEHYVGDKLNMEEYIEQIMNLCQYSGHLKCDFYAAQGAILWTASGVI